MTDEFEKRFNEIMGTGPKLEWPISGRVCCEKPKRIPPVGHLWCDNCRAFTPHEDKYCRLCGSHHYYDGCPNCSWWDEGYADGPDRILEVMHHPGCHFERESETLLDAVGSEFEMRADSPAVKIFKEFFNQNIWRVSSINCAPRKIQEMWFDGVKEDGCGCPREPIIFHLNVWGFHSRQDYFGEWSGGFKVMCPQCGTVFDQEW